MSSLSESFRSQNEAIHGELFILHDDIYRRALKRIKDALLILHKIEDHKDIRKQVRGYVTEFEALREDLERIGRTAADFRSRLIRENGCSGECTEQREADARAGAET